MFQLHFYFGRRKSMCGIVGFSVIEGCPDLSAALISIRHRGPDASGSYITEDRRIGIGNTRLAILDVSESGLQPMGTDDGRYWLVLNGEIYNYRELRVGLEERGCTFIGTSDTEVLLKLIEAYGLDILPKLNGIFAFAILDKSDDTLTLVRDGVGVKPLYISDQPNGVYFASEVKALTALGVDVSKLDRASIERYLTYLWCPGDGTPTISVRKVQPGEAISIKAGRVTRRWRWYKSPALTPQPRRDAEALLTSELRDRLRTAVHRQMVSDVPVGAFLSGGLDSSSVVAFAREVNPAIQCFTIETTHGVEPGAFDDLPYAKAVAAHLNVPLEIVPIDPGTLIRDLECMVYHLDEPLADPACLNVLYISQLARAAGVKVLLSGAGGDDLFTGYRRHQALRSYETLDVLPKPIRRALSSLATLLTTNIPLFRRARKYLRAGGLDGDRRLVEMLSWHSRKELEALYTGEFRHEVTNSRPGTQVFEYLQDMTNNAAPLDRLLALEQRFFLADHNLIYTDKMSMATGVEVRVPFLDLDLVQFASTVPHALKQHGSTGKWILKKAMEPILPPTIIHRPKSGFGAPLRKWILSDLEPLLSELLSTASLSRRGMFKPQAVHDLILANRKGHVDAAYLLFSLMCLELWCRHFIDSPPTNRTFIKQRSSKLPLSVLPHPCPS